jgi:hypothetical protein
MYCGFESSCVILGEDKTGNLLGIFRTSDEECLDLKDRKQEEGEEIA